MLDTIGLRCEPGSFTVSKEAELTLYPAQYQLNDGSIKNEFYLFDLEGKEITGSKAILNREKYQVTIDSRGLFTQLSIPKYARGNNFKLSDKSECTEVLNNLEQELRSEGISTDINEAKISRIDSCKNTFLKHPTGQYFSFFNSLNASRLKDKNIYAAGYRWQNTRHQIVAYDKREEMINRKEDTSGIPKNVIRFEYRLMNGRKVREALGMQNVKQLKNYFGLIEENYNKQLSESIFSLDPDNKKLFQSKTIENYLEYSLSNYSRSWYLHFASGLLFGREGLIIDEKSLFDMLENVLERIGSKYKRKRKYELRKAINDKRQIVSDISQVNVRTLYRELRDKVLKVA